MSLVHQKVSALPDGLPATLVQPSEWNEPHIFNPALTGLLADPTGANAFVGIAASAAGMYLKRKRNVTSVTYAFEAAPVFWVSDFTWSQSPGGALSNVGVTSLALAYLPDGITVAQSINNHYIAIVSTDPTKTESCLIVGIAGTTIQFQTVNNHTAGTWTIQSASGGIQEAISAAEVGGGNGGSVLMPYGNVNIYGTVKLAGSPAIKLMGHGPWSTNLILDRYAMATKDCFVCTNTAQLISLSDFLISGNQYHTAGWGIKLENNSAGYPTLRNIHIADTFNGVYLNSCDYVVMENVKYQQIANQNPNSGNPAYGIKITGVCSNIILDNCFVFSPHTDSGTTATDTWHLPFGIYIDGADGVCINNAQVRADAGVWIEAKNAGQIGTVLVSNSIIDSCRTYNVVVTEAATPTVYGNILFSNCHIIRNYENAPGIYISAQYSTSVIGFTGCTIGGFRQEGIFGLNANNVAVDNCTIIDNNCQNSTYSGIYFIGGTKITITNNRIWDSRGGSKLQRYGIALANTITHCNIIGNVMKDNVSSGMNNLATLSDSRIDNNIGVDDIVGSVASGGTIAIPASGADQFFLTGVTPVVTINGAIGNGHEITIFPENGASFTAAGNIAIAYTVAAANTMVILRWNGTSGKWFIK